MNQFISQQNDDLHETILRYAEVDDITGVQTGRSVSFVGVKLQPLQYGDLIGQKLGNKITIPLAWEKARVFESTIPDISIKKYASCNTVLNSTYSSKTIGLVKAAGYHRVSHSKMG